MIDHDVAVAAVQRILVENLFVHNVALDAKIEEMDIDSLDIVEVLMDLENEFDFLTMQKQVDQLVTVNDLVELVKQNGTRDD